MFRIAALVALLAGTSTAYAAESDKYLPADTELVIRLNVRQMLDTPALKNDKDALERTRKIVQRLLADYEPALKHLDAGGVDVYRDLTALTMALPGDSDTDKAFIVLDGKFDPAKLQAAAEAAAKKPDAGLKIVKLAGRDVYELKLPSLDQPVIACVLDGSTLVASGRKNHIAAAVAKLKEKADPPKKLQPLLALLDDKQHLSFAGTRGATVKLLESLQLPFSDTLPALLEDADAVHGGLVIGKDVDLTIRFLTRDEKTARQFFQQMTIVVAVARGAIAKKAKEDASYVPLVELMKTLRTGVEENTVVWRAQLTLALTEKLLGNLGK
jgi:hypothetical protein